MIPLNVIISCLMILSFYQPCFAHDNVEGIWIDDTGKGAIQILSCGDTDNLCGHIVWLHYNKGQNAQLLTDKLNPDPTKRSQPICGLQVIGQLRPQTNGSWDKGWIYDPKQGQSFDVAVRRLTEDQIEVTGYLGVKFLGKALIWRRAPHNIKACNK